MDQEREVAYHNAGNNPLAWWLCGQELIASSEILHTAGIVTLPVVSDEVVSDELDAQAMRELRRAAWVFGPIQMLRAFGVEACLKALYLDNGGVLVRNGRTVSPTQRPHDLLGLARAVNLPLSRLEREVLEVLEHWIQDGRYPVQFKLEAYDRPGPQRMPHDFEWLPDHELGWSCFWTRLRDEGRARERIRGPMTLPEPLRPPKP